MWQIPLTASFTAKEIHGKTKSWLLENVCCLLSIYKNDLWERRKSCLLVPRQKKSWEKCLSFGWRGKSQLRVNSIWEIQKYSFEEPCKIQIQDILYHPRALMWTSENTLVIPHVCLYMYWSMFPLLLTINETGAEEDCNPTPAPKHKHKKECTCFCIAKSFRALISRMSLCFNEEHKLQYQPITLRVHLLLIRK